MKEAWLLRDESTETHTFGRLVFGNKVLYTMERPWLGNMRSQSCIPLGSYDVSYLPKSYSGKYRDVYHIQEVGGRTGILIHKGNLVADTTGCVLIGVSKGKLEGEPAVLSSVVALSILHQWAEREPFRIIVVSSNGIVLDGHFEDPTC
ncbi:DUF5675 family protein [Porticoccaceae bacterium]|nr:DUF5675 family protein [Porticoccaceae bacterium]